MSRRIFCRVDWTGCSVIASSVGIVSVGGLLVLVTVFGGVIGDGCENGVSKSLSDSWRSAHAGLDRDRDVFFL